MGYVSILRRLSCSLLISSTLFLLGVKVYRCHSLYGLHNTNINYKSLFFLTLHATQSALLVDNIKLLSPVYLKCCSIIKHKHQEALQNLALHVERQHLFVILSIGELITAGQ